MSDIRLKRGASLNLTLAFANADGTAFDLSAVSVAGSVVDARGNFVAALDVVPGAALGVATVSVGSTTNWPDGLLTADFLVVTPGMQTISQSVSIRVERGATSLGPDPGVYNPITGLMSGAGSGGGGAPVLPPLVISGPSQSVSGTAAVAISGYLAVAAGSGGVVPGDSANAALAGSVIGVAINGALAGGVVNVQGAGAVSFAGWNWVAGEAVFVGAGGVLTQVPPAVGFSQVMGVAETATTLVIDIGSPVIL